MQEFSFHGLTFKVTEENRVFMASGFGFCAKEDTTGGDLPIVEVQVSGEDHAIDGAHRMVRTSEGRALRYVSHTVSDDRLEITQRSPRVEVKTSFVAYSDTNAVRVSSRVTNVTEEDIVLTAVSAFVLHNFGKNGTASMENVYLHDYMFWHHTEARGRVRSLKDCGIDFGSSSLRQANIGSWSTKEFAPQGILEDREIGNFAMFQIESNSAWYWELGLNGASYLYLGGQTEWYHSWSRKLAPNASYETLPVAVANGKTLNEVLGEMANYRRHLKRTTVDDEQMPLIFNEYMHWKWDGPDEASCAKTIPEVARMGVDYYVIDCGWHDEVEPAVVYHYVGEWKESATHFPSGVKKTIDLIHSHGMKAGLWIEPEVVGMKCQKMIDYYGDECFIQRNGKKVCELGRYLLDFRHEKVRNYLSETIDRMVNEYGVDYIKFDYNQDCGPGTDYNSFSRGEGLEDHMQAYYEWTETMVKKYPNVIFEACASGGSRMDYRTLSTFSLMSTSDQTEYARYPYIVGNMFACILPEQAAVWNYPVRSKAHRHCEDKVNENVGDEVVVMNMVNSLLGRMHLASPFWYLNDHKKAILKEGLDYARTLTEMKKVAKPYLPLGYVRWGASNVAVGLKTDDKLYLAVWNLKEPTTLEIPLVEVKAKSAKVGYPLCLPTDYILKDNVLTVNFTEPEQARFFEIELETE